MFLDVFLAAVSTLEGQLLGRAVTATWLLTLEVKECGAALGGRQGASTEIPALASALGSRTSLRFCCGRGRDRLSRTSTSKERSLPLGSEANPHLGSEVHQISIDH